MVQLYNWLRSIPFHFLTHFDWQSVDKPIFLRHELERLFCHRFTSHKRCYDNWSLVRLDHKTWLAVQILCQDSSKILLDR